MSEDSPKPTCCHYETVDLAHDYPKHPFFFHDARYQERYGNECLYQMGHQ